VSGTGSTPRPRRSRPSAAVAGEIPAMKATWRSDALGSLRNNSPAYRRPDAGSSGLDLPSRPTRAVTLPPVGGDSLSLRTLATLLVDRPATAATARSDHDGCD